MTDKNDVPAPKSKPFKVRDLLAKTEPRIHEIGGVEYKLTAQKFTDVPRAHALAFLCDRSFEVVDDKGMKLEPLPEIQNDAANGGIRLRPGQVVAAFTELNDEALASRCSRLPDSEDLIDAGRDAMIEALTNYVPANAKGEAEMYDNAAPMPRGDIDRMLANGNSQRIANSLRA
jgi:hypothetical protein